MLLPMRWERLPDSLPGRWEWRLAGRVGGRGEAKDGSPTARPSPTLLEPVEAEFVAALVPGCPRIVVPGARRVGGGST